MKVGDQLLLKDGKSASVRGLTVRNERQKVYNLQVLRLHNYSVGNKGVLVHNRCALGHHGNSRKNSDGQHNYVIKDKDGRVQKTGVGTGEAQDGVSKRAESQVDRSKGETYEVVDRHAPGEGARGKAYDREQELTNELFKANEPMDMHKHPTPKLD